MSVPRATLRIQLHRHFTFADAMALVGYFAALGISHLYASPIMTARPGSTHGYDSIDLETINPELGGENGLRSLVHELRKHDMGLILDIVPNRMAVGHRNAWWMDVLARGQTSRYAKYFDIVWDAANLRGKVLLPVLGRPYGDALKAGDITLRRDAAGVPIIGYFDHTFPLADASIETISNKSKDAFDGTTTAGREQLHTFWNGKTTGSHGGVRATTKSIGGAFSKSTTSPLSASRMTRSLRRFTRWSFGFMPKDGSTACASTTSTGSLSRKPIVGSFGRVSRNSSADAPRIAGTKKRTSSSKRFWLPTKRCPKLGKPTAPPVMTLWMTSMLSSRMRQASSH